MKKVTKNDKNGDSMAILEFASIDDMLSTAKRGYTGQSDTDQWTFGKNSECNSREKTESLLRSGKGLSSVRKLARKYRDEFANTELNEIMSTVRSTKRVRRYNDFDGNLDFDRVMAGDMNYWEKITRDADNKVVRIGINYGVSHQNKQSDFSRIVALSAVFAEILENLGYGVEIYATALYKNSRYLDSNKGKNKRSKWLGMSFPVKSTNEPLDFERIYSLGLQGLLRDILFRTDEAVYSESNGLCLVAPQNLIKLANIDVLITKSWTTEGKQVETILQAIENLQ